MLRNVGQKTLVCRRCDQAKHWSQIYVLCSPREKIFWVCTSCVEETGVTRSPHKPSKSTVAWIRKRIAYPIAGDSKLSALIKGAFLRLGRAKQQSIMKEVEAAAGDAALKALRARGLKMFEEE